MLCDLTIERHVVMTPRYVRVLYKYNRPSVFERLYYTLFFRIVSCHFHIERTYGLPSE